jgi:TolB-like protein
MKQVIILILVSSLYFISCQSQAPVIEVDYQAQALDIQLNNLTNQMVKSLSQENKSKIAIMEFPDLHGNISEFGKFIPEELTTRLFMTRKFNVLERQLLNKVLDEQNLGLTGLIDASSAAQVGKVLGVDAIVTGTVTDIGNMIRINARLISTETAGVFAVASVSIEKEPHIVEMMNRFSPQPARLPNSPPLPPEAEMKTPPERIPAAAPVGVAKATVEEFEFEVVANTLTPDNRLIIDVMITNKAIHDKEITIRNASKLYDNLGQEYDISVRSVGTKVAGRHSHLNHLFISNLPTKMTMEFEKIDPRAESVALLHLSLWNLRNDAQLRNIKINR